MGRRSGAAAIEALLRRLSRAEFVSGASSTSRAQVVFEATTNGLALPA